MKEILVIIILVEIILYLLGFVIYVLYTNKKRNENYEKMKKESDEQFNRVKSKILDRDLKKWNKDGDINEYFRYFQRKTWGKSSNNVI